MKLAIAADYSSKNWRFYTGLIIGWLLITFLIAVPYINSQRVFLGGDVNDGFYQIALQVTHTFRQSPPAAFQLIYQSFERDYNKFFSLPLIPFILIFGDSYLAYVISLAIVYLFPFSLVVGAIATQLIPIYPKTVFASTTLIAALITPNWVTLFQGYPDIGAALMIVLSIWVCLRGVSREFVWLFPYRWQVPVLGFLFGMAVLLRRHFAYGVVAVLGAICLYTAIVFGLHLRHHQPSAWRHLRQFGLQFSLVIATSLVTLLLFAWKFTLRAFTEDYVSLYSSWSRPWQDVLSFYSSVYGWSIWGLSLVGWITGVYTRTLSLPVAVWISAFGSLSIGLWLFRLRYTETYYALHFVPFILLGLLACLWVSQFKFTCRKRSLFLLLLSLVLVLNAVFGLTTLGDQLGNKLPRAVYAVTRPWFATSFSPPIQTDYDRITQMVDFLRSVAPSGEPVFVIYSAQLPMHLLRAAEKTIYGEEDSILNLTQGSPTDSDGFYPIQGLMQAEFVVQTQPFDTWNEPEQRSIKAVFDLFNQEQELTQDFERLPQRFNLSGDTVVTIYRRIRTTPIDRAVRTLHTLQAQVNKPLGRQLDWVALSRPGDSLDLSVKQNRKNKKLMLSAVLSAAQENPASFLYLGALPKQAEMKGRVVLSQSCPEVALTLIPLNQQGQPVNAQQTLQLTRSAALNVQLNTIGADYLLLQATLLQPNAEATQPCCFKINRIKVS